MKKNMKEAANKAQTNPNENAAAAVIAAAAIVEPTATAEAKPEGQPEPKPEAKPAKKQPKQEKNPGDAFEDAQLAALERQREIEAKQRELQHCLKDLENKKKLSEDRSKFIDTLDRLEEAEKQMNPQDFESKAMKLTLHSVNEGTYRSDFSASISNSGLILEFIAMLKKKILAKIEELEAALVK